MVLEVQGTFSSLLALSSTQLGLDLSLLALESKLLALGLFARVALILTQVNPNPTQVDWNLEQVNLKMVLEVPGTFSILLALDSTQLALDLSLLALESKPLGLGKIA